jgi:hypothetical protein
MAERHGPWCFHALVHDTSWDSLCDRCKAERVSEEYIDGYAGGDTKLMEAVFLACENDDRLREEVSVAMDGLIQESAGLSVSAPFEEKHELLKYDAQT